MFFREFKIDREKQEKDAKRIFNKVRKVKMECEKTFLE